MTRRQLEHTEQVLFMRRVALDRRTRNLLMTAVPNGGHRFRAVAAKLKAEGVKAGVPDVLVFEPSCLGTMHGLALEFKVRPNKPTVAQEAWMEALRGRGWWTVVVYSAEEAFAALAGYIGFTP